MAQIGFSAPDDLNPASAQDEFEAARQAFAEGDTAETLSGLARGFQQDVDYRPLYELATTCLQAMDATEESQLFAAALQQFDLAEPFTNLGLHFSELGYNELAQPFLEKSLRIDPAQPDAAHELAILYARRFRIAAAIDVLEAANPRSDVWNYWFWCKLRLLAEKPEGVAEGLDELIELLDEVDAQAEAAITLRQKVEEIQELQQRYHSVGQPRPHIRDWHFIQYGSAILDFYHDDEVAGGRYVAAWGTRASVRQVAVRVKAYAEALGLRLRKIAYLDDRNSEIIARVIGHILHIEPEPYRADATEEGLLIVGASATDFDEYSELAQVSTGQLLFAFYLGWMQAAFISPDLVGLLAQSYTFPWQGGIQVTDPEGSVEILPADERPAAAIAADIAGIADVARPEPGAFDFYLAHKSWLKAIGSEANRQRFHFMLESPVPGAYFS